MTSVLIIQHSESDSEGMIGEILTDNGVDFDLIFAGRDPMPTELDHDALIVLGGAQCAIDDELHSFLAPEKELLRRVVKAEQPCLGLCLGAQLLAHATGAAVDRGARAHFGFKRIRLTEAGRRDPLFADVPREHRMFHWHADAFDVPSGAELLASADYGAPNQAFRIGRRAYGVQYHIELDEPLLRAWLDEARTAEPGEAVAPPVIEEAERDASAHYLTYRRNSRTMLANFLQLI